MPLLPPILYNPSVHTSLLPQLAQIHASCILTDGTMVTFLPDSNGKLDDQKLLDYWHKYAEEITTGRREIIMQCTDESESEVMGYVSLYMPESETGPFRSEVQKLLVSPKFRYQGVARRVMGKLEEVAGERGRGLIMLDTTIGSGAEHVYPKFGYKVLGTIPKYGFHPLTGKLADELFFWKDLREHK